ncbi:hypothetical protein NFI96_009821, partial [Prochilodus magdalenae]
MSGTKFLHSAVKDCRTQDFKTDVCRTKNQEWFNANNTGNHSEQQYKQQQWEKRNQSQGQAEVRTRRLPSNLMELQRYCKEEWAKLPKE